MPSTQGTPQVPEVWPPAQRAMQLMLRPIERFLQIEATSGVVLLAGAIAALVFANSPWADAYEHLLHAPVTFGVGPYTTTNSLHFWVNDGLMVIFFFVVGLEIRRELHQGELSEWRRAALPVAAAFGGMLAPALIFLSLNFAEPTRRGWGIPMATDIAFAVGVLSLLGRRVPAALRVLLLALAIIDDIGAIIVIALFYSSGVSLAGFLIAALGVFGVLFLQRIGVRRARAYVPFGIVIWFGCLRAGIHPTIAGVILGLLTPAKPWLGERGFIDAVRDAVEDFRGRSEREGHREEDLLDPLAQVHEAQREALAPVVRLQTALHPWVAFLIMPIFAFANAGVNVSGLDLNEPAIRPVAAGVALGLVFGKPIGVLALSYVAVRSKLAAFPRGVKWRGLTVVGAVAGIGFTMSIFIADLAFSGSPMLGTAKLAILVASLVSGVAALFVGRVVLRGATDPGAARTPSEAEASTES